MEMERVLKLKKNESTFAKKNIHGLRVVSNKNVITKQETPHFLKDFEKIVQEEMQKSSYCIGRITADIIGYNKELRFQLRALKELWRLVPPSKDREARAVKIMDKIAATREAIKEGEECILLITRRALLLQEELGVLSLSHYH
ncbi:MAG: hypothetical protein K0R24_1831 [Gammaproteobacteria bacterium]|jgi:hypothetical protein|nr:hypothetical protein [Gammaproteobacteria bacterium]